MHWDPAKYGYAPPIPYNFVALIGNGDLRVVTMPLPTEIVRNFLPYEMTLGSQSLTPSGTHPVMLFFYDMFQAHMTIPTLLPSLTYHEQILGIPYTFVKPGVASIGASGPCFFMPQLFLDDYLATIGGRLWWGFPKNLARIEVTNTSYDVKTLETAEDLIRLEFQQQGSYKPVVNYPLLDPVREIMSQPIVSQLPMGYGPFVACSNFDKDWSTAQIRPLSSSVHIAQSFVAGLPTGRFPPVGETPGIDQSPLGSFVMKTTWRQGPLYPVCMANDHAP